MNLDMTQFHQTFFEEATELLSDMENLLLRLEETPTDLDLLNTIFRCAHSIKGGSATFGFTDIAHFTHDLETLLDLVRNGRIGVDGALTQLLLESQDQMKALLSAARGEIAAAPDATELTGRIQLFITGGGAQTTTSPIVQSEPAGEDDEGWGVFAQPQKFRLRIVPGHDILKQGADPLLLLDRLSREAEILSLVCDTSSLPALTEIDPENCYLAWDIELRTDLNELQILEFFDFIADESEIVLTAIEAEAPLTLVTIATTEPTTPKPEIRASPPSALQPATKAASSQPSETQTLRVTADKVDKLINLVGELVINQSMLNEVVQDFSMAKLPRLLEAVAEMERASRELQERVMAVRMLPIKHAFGRFPRLVRDLANAVGKKVELRTSGEETELDKGVIEAIADPLTHLVRNSIDHGLETPSDRIAAGKPEVGIISLHAVHEGGNIAIEITDDGRGLNRERILAKAIERGWIAENETPTDEVINNFIFQPGFSTAAQVTDLSGRGVGMDIVKQGVQALGGSITLTSTPGVGTTFRIRLPLTMAILEGLSLCVGSETYIVPLTSIVESIRPKAGDVRTVAGAGEVVLVRDEILPILRLYNVFGMTPRYLDPTEGLLVIVETDQHKVALFVDELIGQSQVVIKSLETNYRKIPGIAGATILGDGRVSLILDVPGLINDAKWDSPTSVAA